MGLRLTREHSKLTALLFVLLLGYSSQQVSFSNAMHSVSLSPSTLTVTAGGSNVLNVTVTSESGTYYLAAENVPSGVTVSFFPLYGRGPFTSGTGTFTVRTVVAVALGSAPGNYQMMITATTKPERGVMTVESASASFILIIPRGPSTEPPPPPTQLLPDLAIMSVGSNPSGIRAGDAVVFTATIQNLGNAGVENVPVALTLDGERIGTMTVTLAPGQTTTVQSTPWKAVAGSHVMIWIVDPGQTIQEARRDNNSLTHVFIVQAAAGQPSPQTSITRETSSAATSIGTGQALPQAGQDNVLIYAVIAIGFLAVIGYALMKRKPAKRRRSK